MKYNRRGKRRCWKIGNIRSSKTKGGKMRRRDKQREG